MRCEEQEEEEQEQGNTFSSLATHGEEEPRHRVPPQDGLKLLLNRHPALRGGERSIE